MTAGGVSQHKGGHARCDHPDARHNDGGEPGVDCGAGLLEDVGHVEDHGGHPRELGQEVEDTCTIEWPEESLRAHHPEESGQPMLLRLSLVFDSLFLILALDDLLNLLSDVVLGAPVPLEAGTCFVLPVILYKPVGRFPAAPHGEGEEEGAGGADPAGGPPVKQEAEEVDLGDAKREEDGGHHAQAAAPVRVRDLRHENTHAWVGGADGQGRDKPSEENDRDGGRHRDEAPGEEERETGDHRDLPPTELCGEAAAQYAGGEAGHEVEGGDP